MHDSLGYVAILIVFFLSWITGCQSVEQPIEAPKASVSRVASVAPKVARKRVQRVQKAYETVSAKLLNVVDGDTLHVELKGEKKSIRLGFIDAPESNFFHKKQKYGDESKENLVKLCAKYIGKPIELTILSNDPRYGRINGLVKVGSVDVSTYQVETGWAWVYPQFNKNPELPIFQESARKHRIGLWRDSRAIEPWLWRKENKGKSL